MTEPTETNHRRIRRRRLTAVAVASLALIGGACGSGGDADAVSRDEFATRVNALCEAEHEEVDKLFTDFPEEPTPEDMKELVADFLLIIREYRDDVKSVGPPSGNEDLYDEYVTLLDDAVSRYEVASTDAAKAEALFNEDDNRLSDIEKRLDLDVCASR